MTTIYNAAFSTRLIISFFLIAVCISSILYVVWNIYRKGKWYIYVANVLLFLTAFSLYQMIHYIGIFKYSLTRINSLLKAFYKTPVDIVAFITIALSVFAIVMFVVIIVDKRNSITPMSIKESVDKMPYGICYYLDGGQIALINIKMDKLSRMFFGEPMYNGAMFMNRIRRGRLNGNNTVVSNGEIPIVEVEDGKIYSFAEYTSNSGRYQLWKIIATDITEEYKKNIEYKKLRAHMLRINRRLKDFSKNITNYTIERELLESKIRVHDELGNALIASKRYIQSGDIDKDEVLNLWRNSLNLLKNMDEEEKNTVEMVVEMARTAGIEVRINGDFKDRILSDILVSALSNSVTNTYRHAHGDLVEVFITDRDDKYVMTVKNNGDTPKERVEEKGGLKNLRYKVEGFGGKMYIEYRPEYMLWIELPKRRGFLNELN